MEFLGSIDACDSMAIEGWLWFPDMPKFKPEVEVFSGQTLLGSAIANTFRADLLEKKVADGKCAFRFEPQIELSGSDVRAVRIRPKGGAEFMLLNGHRIPAIEVTITDESFKKIPSISPEKIRIFKKCILHIGMEKTGTTSIQSFLALNREELLRRGLFMPISLTP